MGQYEINSYNETKIIISMQDDFSYLSEKMTLKTLLARIEKASTIKDLIS